MSDERDALLLMLREGQRAVQSRTANAAAAAAAAANLSSSSTAASGDATAHTGPLMGRGHGHRHGPHTSGSPALNARDNLNEFLRHYYTVFRAFAENPDQFELVLSSELSPYDRHALHDLAQACGLSHESRGQDSDRVLVLRRDALFHGNAKQYERVNLEAIAERISGKASKHDVARHKPRRDRNAPEPRPGELGSYADEDAARKLARFENAKNEFRHATHMGYTHEEALAMERDGVRLEDILRGDADDAEGSGEQKTVVAPSSLAKAQLRLGQQQQQRRTDGTSKAAGAVEDAADPASRGAADKAPAVYYETCKGCGSRVRLEGDWAKWKCLHYCARCTKQTIWVLEEDTDTGLVLTPRQDAGPGQRRKDMKDMALPTTAAGGARERGAEKRQRPGNGDEEEEAYGSQRPLRLERSDSESDGRAGEEGGDRLSIDRSDSSSEDDDADAEGTSNGDEGKEWDDDGALTVDDVVDSAAINDFSDEDTNWIRSFAQCNKAHLQDHIIFCIEFSDLVRAPIFRRYDAGSLAAEGGKRKTRIGQSRGGARRGVSGPCVYAVVRAIGASASHEEGHQSVTSLIDKVLAAAVFPKEGEADKDAAPLAVAFKNLSAYGIEATAVCQLRGTSADASPGLLTLQRELGTRHLFLTPDLAEAVAKASEE